MRAVIISQIDNVFKKIVWIKECSGGIYFGFYGKSGGTHFSYHQSGDMHLKQGTHYLDMPKRKAIENIKKYEQLGAYGITLEGEYDFATDDYTRIKDMLSVIYIDPQIIKRGNILNVHSYIIRKGNEIGCISDFKSANDLNPTFHLVKQGFETINANFFKLEKFPNHLVGIIITGGK